MFLLGFGLFGGHIVWGAIFALIIVMALHGQHNNLLMSIVLYFVLCFGFWIVGDWIWGAYQLPSTTD